MSFPNRYRKAKCPGYDDLTFRLLANPTGLLYDKLLMGDTSTEERAAALGALLSEAYDGEKVEGYGFVFDFSTPAGAVDTIQNEAIPIDLRRWIRNAPIDVVTYEREETRSNLAASFGIGN